MRGHLWVKVVGVLVVAITMAGCTGQVHAGRAPPPSPALSGTTDPDGTVAEAPAPKTVSYVDRHPLLSKPRDYYESSGDNKIVKTAAATFVGVPVGIYSEIKQIVVGTPPETR